MNYILRSRTHIAVAFLLVATIIFILHQMLSNVADPVIHTTPVLKTDMLKSKLEDGSEMQYNRNELPRLSYKLGERFSGERLVHLDLKGAPPLAHYLVQIFPLFKQFGATGVLLEYEDMFPYYKTLSNIPAYNAYNTSEIQMILNHAERNKLKVIPLVQTFGHLEFVLKLEEYRKLREVESFPQVICPTNSESLPFITKMIDQVIALHPGIEYLHIGSDEVYHIGRCERCSRLMAKNLWTKHELFLSHLHNVTTYVNKNYPHVRPIMWDDELRTLPEEMIRKFDIPKMVDIMIWKYTPTVEEFITEDVLEKYSKLFGEVWIASAFKGASSPDSIITNVMHHLKNHVAWMDLVNNWRTKLRFKGIAITGWQRYDHFAVLCELLPVAIPSLAVCLQYLEGNEVNDNTMSSLLKCNFPFAWGPQYVASTHPTSTCSYPGSALYHLIHSFYITLQEIKQLDKDIAHGWLNWYNVINQFSNPPHVETATSMVDYHKIQVQYLEEQLRIELMNVYDTHTTEEWLGTNLLPSLVRLLSLSEARDKLLQQQVWPRRPLDISISVKKELEKICVGKRSEPCTLLGTFS